MHNTHNPPQFKAKLWNSNYNTLDKLFNLINKKIEYKIIFSFHVLTPPQTSLIKVKLFNAATTLSNNLNKNLYKIIKNRTPVPHPP